MSETKAVFAEGTIRSSQNILHQYLKDYGYKYKHRLPHFISSLNSRRNSSIDMRPNTVKICNIMSIPYSKPLREHKKPTFKIGDRVRNSKYDLLFRKGYKPQFTREVFEIVAFATRKPPTYTIKDDKSEVIRGKFYQKELNKSFNNGFAYNRVGFQRFWRLDSRQCTQFFYKLFTRATELGGAMGGCNFRNFLPINVPKYNGGEFQIFWRETFKFYDNLQSRTWSIHFHHRHCGSHEYAH